MDKELKRRWESVCAEEQRLRENLKEFIDLLLVTNDPIKITSYWIDIGKIIELLKIAIIEKDTIDDMGDFSFRQINKELTMAINKKGLRKK